MTPHSYPSDPPWSCRAFGRSVSFLALACCMQAGRKRWTRRRSARGPRRRRTAPRRRTGGTGAPTRGEGDGEVRALPCLAVRSKPIVLFKELNAERRWLQCCAACCSRRMLLCSRFPVFVDRTRAFVPSGWHPKGGVGVQSYAPRVFSGLRYCFCSCYRPLP